jgi:pimeloyl-ACP methyl ester carboxylesterase
MARPNGARFARPAADPERDRVTPVERIVRDVTARGVRMRVLEAGSSAAPPLVCIHGFFVNHQSFEDVIDELAEHFFVIAPDLPGFGESEKPSPARYGYGVEAFAEAIADLMAAFGVGPAHIVGHAMGAAVAITLASRHRELVDHLVLVDPLCYRFPLPLKARIVLTPVVGAILFKQLLGRALFRAYFRDDYYGPTADIPFDRIDDHYRRFNTPSARESAYAVMNAVLDTRTVVAQLPRIAVPTLVVWGRDDKLFPASNGVRLAREIHGAKLHIMDSGHAPHEERPREFVAITTEFLEGRR